MFNGYTDEVTHMYSGMDLHRDFIGADRVFNRR
jgi:hypothetical protein